MTEHDLAFRAMGCDLRLLVGPPAAPGMPSSAEAAADARAWVEDFDARLSRFREGSELTALNEDRREEVPASGLLRAAVAAARWAAERTRGLVDPTLVGDLESLGYARSLADVPRASLSEALASGGDRSPARPRPDRAWEAIEVDDAAGTIRRPRGLRIDTGGTGKGLAADAVALRLERHSRACVDMAGDLRICGPDAARRPYEVAVEHPLTGAACHTFRVGGGGIATSGVGSRIWRAPSGGFAHHLLDPATGLPAWTGVLMATALAPSALEAETIAKAAVLSGPDAAAALLAPLGGLLVTDDGAVHVSEPPAMPRVRLVRSASPRGVAA